VFVVGNVIGLKTGAHWDYIRLYTTTLRVVTMLFMGASSWALAVAFHAVLGILG
jgi:hypothetical protein